MAFKVVKVYDGDSFTVDPRWEWKGRNGDGVRLADFDAPEKGRPGYDEAAHRLTQLLLGKNVELKNVRTIDVYGRLICDVHLNGANILQPIPR